jgi:hypothetical protein
MDKMGAAPKEEDVDMVDTLDSRLGACEDAGGKTANLLQAFKKMEAELHEVLGAAEAQVAATKADILPPFEEVQPPAANKAETPPNTTTGGSKEQAAPTAVVQSSPATPLAATERTSKSRSRSAKARKLAEDKKMGGNKTVEQEEEGSTGA